MLTFFFKPSKSKKALEWKLLGSVLINLTRIVIEIGVVGRSLFFSVRHYADNKSLWLVHTCVGDRLTTPTKLYLSSE